MKKELNISNLTIGHQQKPLLKNINLKAKTNQIIAVFGRNGQGKSTLLKTISGLLPAISGNFTFENRDVLNLKEKERAKLLSIVSTSQNNVEGITVKDFIAFGRFPYTNWLGINSAKDYLKIEHAIELCQIAKLTHRNYNELSDGEKQKVNIARAIAQETPLILLDEPTVHLDLINKVEVFKLLKKLSTKHHKTIIISTHQIEYALQICDEIWLVNDNDIDAFSPNELINSNKLNQLFDDDIVSFDKHTQSFKIR